jgi:polyphosphate kinase 2 (PPK2 family)
VLNAASGVSSAMKDTCHAGEIVLFDRSWNGGAGGERG